MPKRIVYRVIVVTQYFNDIAYVSYTVQLYSWWRNWYPLKYWLGNEAGSVKVIKCFDKIIEIREYLSRHFKRHPKDIIFVEHPWIFIEYPKA